MATLYKIKYWIITLGFFSAVSFITWSSRMRNYDHNQKQGIFSMPITYTTTATAMRGESFPIDGSIPFQSPDYFINLTNYDLRNFTFVTAADRNHFNESKDAIAGFQKVFPGYRFVYYDLGLDPEDVKKIKEWCNVEVRSIEYDRYPPHIRDHLTYGFKAVIIYTMIHEVDAIFWIDSSIRPLVTNTTEWSKVFDAVKTSGILLFDHTGHTIHEYTHPGMFKYVPVDMEKLKTQKMLGGGVVLLYRTKRVFWEIVHWFYLCGLTPDCITPPGHMSDCPNVKPNVTFCHRYDQSLINILFANFVLYNHELYTSPTDFIMVERFVTNRFKLEYC